MTMRVRVEVAMMLSVTMTIACRREAVSVVIDDHRTVAYLVATVPVDISNGIVVIAVTVPRRAGGVAVPVPALGQLMSSRVNIQGHHLMTGIDTACKEDAGFAAIQIGCTKEVFRRAVAIAVAPCCL